MRLARLAALAAAMMFAARLEAKPPLETIDMPSTKSDQAELYLGYQYLQDPRSVKSLPAAALSLGLSDRDEIDVSAPYETLDGHHGFGDVRLATKYMLNYSQDRGNGISGYFEAKLKNGDQAAGLGSGAIDYNARLIMQQSWKTAKAYVNLGQTWVGQPVVNGQPAARHNVREASIAEENNLASKLKFINEFIWSTSAYPDTSYRLAATTGLRYSVSDNFELHATMGRSLRSGNLGGPRSLIYAGLKFAFASVPPSK